MTTSRGNWFRRPLALLAVAVVFVGGAVAVGPAAAAPTPPGAAAASGATWIVTLRDGVDASFAGHLLTRQQSGTLLGVYSHVLDGFSFTGSADAAAAIARNPLVARVEVARGLHAVEIAPNGILRTSAWAAHDAGYTGVTTGGTPVRVAVVDTGIQLDHPDLAGNVDAADGVNCIDPGQPPNDDHGHGTHVAGTVGAAFNGVGVVGMATNVQLVPVKVLNATGFGTDAQVICGLDAVAALAQAQPGPYVVNMSLGDPNRPNETTCGASALHQAICGLNAAGVTVVAAAGNDGTDAVSFVPAAYGEVIAVSAFTDFDGRRSFAGCQTDFTDYLYQCDDNLADFSNYGSVVDVAAPGVHVLSDWIGGGQSTISGSSMAAPHVAGAAALVLGANPALTPAQVRSVLQTTGECPDGAVAGAPTCAGHGQWQVGSLFGGGPDKDGIPEPLINALRAAQAAGAAGPPPPPPPPPPADTTPPTVGFTAPASNATVRGAVNVTAAATDNVAVDRVEFSDGSTPIGTDTTAPYSVSWATAGDGPHTLTATAFDAAGSSATDTRTVNVDNTAPSVAVTGPTGTVSGTVTITADSVDPVPGSGVASVQLLVDGSVVGTDTSAPFGAAWNTATVSNGNHTLTARATDAVGNTATSAAVVVTVSNSTPSTVMTITSLHGSGQVGWFTWTSWVDVTVVDQAGRAVSGATVTFAVSGGVNTTRSCTTNGAGKCSTSGNKVTLSTSSSNVTYTTTNVAKSGATWDGQRWAVTLRLR